MGRCQVLVAAYCMLFEDEQHQVRAAVLEAPAP